MTEEEYNLTSLELRKKIEREHGSQFSYEELWSHLIEARRESFRFERKALQIIEALLAFEKAGLKPVFKDWQNGHIQLTTRRGTSVQYYPTTGTITGFRDTGIHGIDACIELCKR